MQGGRLYTSSFRFKSLEWKEEQKKGENAYLYWGKERNSRFHMERRDFYFSRTREGENSHQDATPTGHPSEKVRDKGTILSSEGEEFKSLLASETRRCLVQGKKEGRFSRPLTGKKKKPL